MSQKFRARIPGIEDDQHLEDVNMKKNYKDYRNKFLFIMAILVFMFYIFTSAKIVTTVKTVTVIEQVPITINKTFYTNKSLIEKLPYEGKEYFYVKQGVGEQTCRRDKYDYDVDVFGYYEQKNDETRYKCVIQVENKGDEVHNWTMAAKFVRGGTDSGPESDSMTQEIMPGKSQEFVFVLEEGAFRPESCVRLPGKEEIPVKEVCEYSFYQDIRMTRNVTKFRNRTVIRTIKTTKTFTEFVNETKQEQIRENLTINRFFGWRQGFDFGY